MFKRLLKAGMTLALLWGGYVAYGHGFDLVVQHFRTYRSKEKRGFDDRPSLSKQYATALARKSFGDNHWTVTNDQPYAYYSSEHGFWMYSLDFKEIQEEDGVRYDGKRLKLKPAAIIFASKDGKKHQTITGDRATVDLSQPLSLGGKQGGDAMKITHALIEGNVLIRDDHGTPGNLFDDTIFDPMTHLVFDEEKQQITTESPVAMRDAEQTTTGLGMLIQLRKKDPNALAAGQSSTGFEGAEYLFLFKNPRVTLRDVGNSGVMPGSGATKKTSKTAAVKAQAGGGGSAAKKDPSAAPEGPSPLVIMSDGPMRVDFAKDQIPVLVGPPEPPPPTRVKFERNVVALQMHPGREPDQLNCDTLKLTLVPAEKPPEPKSADPASAGATAQGADAVRAGSAPTTDPARPPAEAVARSDGKPTDAKTGDPADSAILGAFVGAMALLDPGAAGSPGDSSGPFGNLTLQKAHATGHAVWLQLREQGATVLCNQLIHNRRAPYQPDMTYFGGDSTRGIWLQKIDREPVEPEDEKTAKDEGNRPSKQPRKGKITGVTHVRTVDATLYDMGGGGMDLSDIVARGPGKLEARPDLKEPVERIAVWQDELTIQNILGPDSQLLRKKITLTGTRPYFVDTLKKASIDSAELIHVWLKPKSAAKAKTASPGGAADLAMATAPASPASDPFAVANATAGDVHAVETKTTGGGTGMGGGGLQMERLQAFRDVHFRAPGKKMEAREVLDTTMVEAEPVAVVASTTPDTSDASGTLDEKAETPAAEAPPGEEPAKADGQSPATVAAKDAPEKPAAEPAMTAVADRIWAKIALKPGSELDGGSSRRRSRTAAKPAGASDNNTTAIAASGSTDAPAPAAAEPDTDIREAWLWGNVSMHQESPPDKPENPDGSKAKHKTQDVTGEAVYMDNYRGKGKMLAWVYDHNPHGPRRPGPWPLARVADGDKTIRSTLIRMDQDRDKIWCDGPGELTQLTERSLFTDKKEEPKPDDEGSAPDVTDPGVPANAAGGGKRIRTSAGPSTAPGAPKGSAPASKPKTRGGRPISDKDLLVITWTDRMEFTGRSFDPTPAHLPAGKAEFFGSPNAQMEDAQLKCVERMIVYTDREMPLGELGAMGQGSNKPGAGGERGDAEGKEDSPVDISLIYCFGESVAVTRKLDPDVYVILEQHIIYAERRLDYNRRTGEFIVPGAGEFYKYERSNESEKGPDGRPKTGESTRDPAAVAGQPNGGRSTAARRTVTPTSGRTASGAPRAADPDRTTTSAGSRSPRSSDAGDGSQPATPPVSRRIPPLILTQIFFTRGLQGQFGTSQDSNSTQDRTALLFGDIQLRHAQVNGVGEAFDFDQPLTEKGFNLTSQILRMIQEPPPAGSPASTPARSFLKAWDNVMVNKGDSLVIQSDVGTYDSGTDTLYAYGEGDRGVTMAQQYAVGQPASPAHGRAVQFNVKSGAAHFVDTDVVQLFDKRTGSRPGIVGTPEPGVKRPRKKGTPFMVPNNNLERRGFTGQ
jgi:hypothetical protein